jgi:protein-S-isoprenylcysteine O-methyltransferase Ste14
VGEGRLRQRHLIDGHKLATGLAVLALIATFGRWSSVTLWVYLGLHGSYGVLWALKSRLFRDRTWDRPAGPQRALVVLGGLTLYWLAPLLIALRGVEAPLWLLALCVALYGAGVFFHFASDMQKHTALKLRPERLIEDGMFALSRNPNYFGELLIYLSFALLALHWAPLLVLALFVAVVWLPGMRRKDRSLSRYPEFEAYRRRTKLWIPGLL